MVGGSAFMFHLNKKIVDNNSDIPGFSDVMRNNPELMKQYTMATMNMKNQPNNFDGYMNTNVGTQQQQPPEFNPMSPPAFRNEPDSRPELYTPPETNIDTILNNISNGGDTSNSDKVINLKL